MGRGCVPGLSLPENSHQLCAGYLWLIAYCSRQVSAENPPESQGGSPRVGRPVPLGKLMVRVVLEAYSPLGDVQGCGNRGQIGSDPCWCPADAPAQLEQVLFVHVMTF